MKSLEYFRLYYSDINFGDKFDESYQKWIIDELKAKDSEVEFLEDSIIVKAPSKVKVVMAILFIGFAFGEQNNGK